MPYTAATILEDTAHNSRAIHSTVNGTSGVPWCLWEWLGGLGHVLWHLGSNAEVLSYLTLPATTSEAPPGSTWPSLTVPPTPPEAL